MKTRPILAIIFGTTLSLLLVMFAAAQEPLFNQNSSSKSGDGVDNIFESAVNALAKSLLDDPPLPIAIVSLPYNQTQHVMAPDGNAGAHIAWRDERLGFGKSLIYSQRVLNDGTTAWTNNGIPPTNPRPPWQEKPAIVSDGAGGSIIRWGEGGIRVQRLDSEGNPLLGQDGKVVIYPGEGYADWSLMVSDDAGGAYLVVAGTTCLNLIAMRIDGMGNRLWSQPVPLSTVPLPNFFNKPMITSDGSGGLIVAWIDYRSDTRGDIYAQRLDSSGTRLWEVEGDDTNGVPVFVDTDGSFAQYNLNAVADDSGGVFIVWQDDRGTQYPLEYAICTNIFAQHLDDSGVRTWSPQGLRLSDIESEPCDWGGGPPCPSPPRAGTQTPVITRDAADGIYVAWYRWHYSFDYSVRTQRINLSGIILWSGISTKGVDLTSGINYANPEVDIARDGVGGAFIAFKANQEGLTQYQDIIVQRVNPDGGLLCGPAGANISNLPGADHLAVIIEGFVGNAIVSWLNGPGDWSNIFAQMVDGECNGQWVGVADVMIRDNRDDDGSTPSQQPWYESPDIWVRNLADGIEQHQNAVAGQENTVYVRALNIGTTPVSDVEVHLYWAEPGLGMTYPDNWIEIGNVTIEGISQDDSETVTIPWTPPRSGHFCLFVRLVTADDPILAEGSVPGENNIAQINVAILNLGAGMLGSDLTASEDFESGYATFEVVNLQDQPISADVILERDELAPEGVLLLDLGDDLYSRWISATGGTLVGAEVISGTTLIDVTSSISATVLGLPLEALERTPVSATVTGPPTDETWLYVNIWERVDGETIGGVVLQAPYVFAATDSLKEVSTGTALQGEVVTCTVSLINTGNHDVINAVITDILPLDVNYVPGSLNWSVGEGQFFFDRILWNGPVSLAQPTVISYAVTVNQTAIPGEMITNTVTIYDGLNPAFERQSGVEVIELFPVFLPLVLNP